MVYLNLSFFSDFEKCDFSTMYLRNKSFRYVAGCVCLWLDFCRISSFE